LYNDTMDDELMPTCKFISVGSNRAKHVKARWENQLPSLQDWERFFKQIKRSDFLCGRKLDRSGKPFRCNFDWLVNDANCTKILEDTYSNVRDE
jgi:hypothetical protein